MELLGLLKLLFILVVLGLTVSSLVGYSSRRRQSKKALAAMREQGGSIRRLSEEERRALPPIHDPAKPKRPLTVESDEVFPLEGAYSRHGIESNGTSTWHDTIGGVEVFLPYDADLFLAEHNRAEVVFAGKMAVVVGLNQEFDLPGAQERDQRRDAADQQWQDGARGALQDVFIDSDTDRDEDPDRDQEKDEEAAARKRRVDIYAQRDETVAEIEARGGRGVGLLPGLLLMLAFIGLGIATARTSMLAMSLWSGAAVLLAVLALWLFWRRWRPGPAQKVNTVTGTLNLTPLLFDESSNTVTVAATLGDKLSFSLPEHWRSHVDYEDGQRLEMDLRVDDYSVVNYNRQLSLDEEIRRFPLAYWGRHFTMALVAGIGLLAALLLSRAPWADGMLTWNAVSGGRYLEAREVSALLASPPGAGSMVDLSGSGRCQVRASMGDWRHPGVHCDWIRWGGDTSALPRVEIDELTAELFSDEVVKTRRDPYVEMMVKLYGRDPRQAPLLVENPRALIELVENACGTRQQHACAYLRDTVVEHLRVSLPEQPTDWDALREEVMGYEGDKPLQAVIGQSELGLVKRRLRAVGRERAGQAVPDLGREIHDNEKGGVLVHMIGDPALTPASMTDIELWRRFVDLTAPGSAEPFSAKGMVVHRGEDDSGAPILVVDVTRQLEWPWRSLLLTVWILLAAVLLPVHVWLAVQQYRAKRRREADLARLHGWAQPS
ncbi:intracellular growth attenuator igaA [Alcanivorax xiamenensis]|uniref:Intracellular growth attenuator igaA n=1 Tax=Alcanivorax xiamenensis TaxID=1177156 RepID=A0ABQ6Y4D7_9GAMM|nr:IgaA/UmoB family intracellular growth attenuator [Alcanivorax xiamenensis]KAF0804048.1 intracellular growth attenuator igaA [Alcanivorax xiamenensis]